MRRFSLRTVLLLAPVLALAALTLGCPKASEPSSGGGPETSEPAVTKKVLQELDSKGWGTLKGHVTLDGPAPEGEIKKQNDELLAAIEKNANKDHCLKAPEAQKTEQMWKIGKDGAVQNVTVWLRPPDGYYFKIDTDSPSWAKEVTIDQPFCAFQPHVVTLFPSSYDPKNPKKGKSTGQKFIIKNSAPMNHNTKWDGGATNPGSNVTLPPGEKKEIDLEPTYGQPVNLSCNIHGWMTGYAWVFNHPYAAVTDENGNYEIKHAPAGADLQVVAWHEKAEYLNGNKGEKIKLDDGKETAKDFKVKAK